MGWCLFTLCLTIYFGTQASTFLTLPQVSERGGFLVKSRARFSSTKGPNKEYVNPTDCCGRGERRSRSAAKHSSYSLLQRSLEHFTNSNLRSVHFYDLLRWLQCERKCKTHFCHFKHIDFSLQTRRIMRAVLISASHHGKNDQFHVRFVYFERRTNPFR